ncbi:MAG: TrkA C-terminal domain-containing protein [Bacteroidota bacterium]
MIELLAANPLLLLFVVAAIGYGIGNIKIRGSKLGVAAVLFVGLFFGSMDKSLEIPNIVFLLGLAIFVYTIGLTSGPGFMAGFQGKGNKNLGFIFGMIVFSGLLAGALFFLFDFTAAMTAGIFTGASTNTAGLAGLLDSIQKTISSPDQERMLESAVVGYSITYPMGVIAGMLAIVLMERLFRIDYEQEAKSLRHQYPIDSEIVSTTLEITSDELKHVSIRDLLNTHKWNIAFGRMRRGEETLLTHLDTEFQVGDFVAVVGRENDIEEFAKMFGQYAEKEITREPSNIEHHRVFISNPEVAGQAIAALNLRERFAVVITRVRRGDIDLLAKGDTVLELGDRVRFTAKSKDVPALIRLFGDSYQKLSQIDLLSFGMGMALGLLLGMITFTLPGGISFQFGFAGGPLIVALILGTLRRTGPIVWTLPYSANLTLRQFGLILLLAAVGIRSGHTFIDTLQQGNAIWIFLGGSMISLGTAFVTLFVGFKLLKIPFGILTGMVANQPAILDFALHRSNNLLPNYGYTMMFPIALISKIVLAQLIFSLLV